jgi:hypothetical protein
MMRRWIRAAALAVAVLGLAPIGGGAEAQTLHWAASGDPNMPHMANNQPFFRWTVVD